MKLRIFHTLVAVAVLGGCSLSRSDRTTCFSGFLTASGQLAEGASLGETRYQALRIDTSDLSERWKALEIVLCDGTRIPLVSASQSWFDDCIAESPGAQELESDQMHEVQRIQLKDGALAYEVFGSYFRFSFVDGQLSVVNILVPTNSKHCPDWRITDRETGNEFGWPLREKQLSKAFGAPVVIKQTQPYFHGW